MQTFILNLRTNVSYLSLILILPLLVLADDLVSFSDEMLDFLLGADEELLNVLTEEAINGSDVWISGQNDSTRQIRDSEAQPLNAVQVKAFEERNGQERKQ